MNGNDKILLEILSKIGPLTDEQKRFISMEDRIPLSSLNPTQLTELFDINPEWVFDHRPDWVSDHQSLKIN